MVVNSLLVRLQQGLTSIYGTLANYATAFEALGGMRGEFCSTNFLLVHVHSVLTFSADQIRSAVEDSATFAV